MARDNKSRIFELTERLRAEQPIKVLCFSVGPTGTIDIDSLNMNTADHLVAREYITQSIAQLMGPLPPATTMEKRIPS